MKVLYLIRILKLSAQIPETKYTLFLSCLLLKFYPLAKASYFRLLSIYRHLDFVFAGVVL